MIRRPPRSTRTDTLCPYTTLFRSAIIRGIRGIGLGIHDEAPAPSLAPGVGEWGTSNVPPTVSSRLTRAIARPRSEEHTSELQSLMRISYAVFCLTKKTTKQIKYHTIMNT